MDSILRHITRLTRPAALAADHVDEQLSTLRAVFAAKLGPEAAARFEVPREFVAYLQAAGGAQYDGWVTFWSLASMVRSTEAWVGRGRSGDPEERPADGPWIHFASYGDKHWLFLCCDRAHPEYGNVAEGYDLIPWMDENELDYNMRAALIDPWGDESPPEARWTFPELLALLSERSDANRR